MTNIRFNIEGQLVDDETPETLDDIYGRIESRKPEDFGEGEPDDDDAESVEETEEESTDEDNLSTDPAESDESRQDNLEEDPGEVEDSEADEPEDDDLDEEVESEDEDAEGEDEDEPEESPDDEDEEEDLEFLDIPDDAIVGQDDDGNPVTFRDLKDGNLMQSRFTERMQELSERERELRNREEERATLTTELLKRETSRQFLNENPEALDILLEDPEDTRKLMSDPEAFDDFWRRYELVKDDPELQEALTSKRKQDEADKILSQREQVNFVSSLARDLVTAIEAVGEQFEGVDNEEVAEYVAELSGVDPDEFYQAARTNPQALVEPMRNLENLFVREDDQGEYIDPRLIHDRFSHLDTLAQQEQSEEMKEQEEHNEKVREEIEQEDERPPATPDETDAPGKTPRTPLAEQVREEGGSLEEFMSRSPNL